MLKIFIGWIMASKAAKVSASLFGGSTLLTAIIWPLFTYHSTQVDAKILHTEKVVREYVDLNLLNVGTKINNLKAGQTEIKDLLKITNKRLYELKKTIN